LKFAFFLQNPNINESTRDLTPLYLSIRRHMPDLNLIPEVYETDSSLWDALVELLFGQIGDCSQGMDILQYSGKITNLTTTNCHQILSQSQRDS